MELPNEIIEFCKVNSFAPDVELPGGHCSRIFAYQNRVLKYPFEPEERISAPISARKLSNVGGPITFAIDPESGSILMERIWPGETLAEADLPDEEAQATIMDFTQRFRAVDPEGCSELTSYYSAHPSLLLDLQGTTRDRVFLHGDLHHQNVLRSGDGWRVIDAKALVGDANFEAVAYLRNPIEWIPVCPDLKSVTLDRLNRFEQTLGLDPWRMVAWALVDRLTEPERAHNDPWFKLLPLYEELLAELPRTY